MWRLVDRLVHPEADIFIHVDKKVNVAFFYPEKNYPGVFFIQNRTVCNWGGYNFLKAVLLSVKEVLDTGGEYSHVNLLSAQDYPLVHADQLYDFFVSKVNMSFISYDRDSDSVWMTQAKKRFESYHLTDFNFKGKYILQNILNKLLPVRKFPSGLRFYGSNKACWWTLNTEAAAYIVSQFEDNRRFFVRFLTYTWGADEFMIPTLLMNSPLRDKMVNNNYRFIDWSEGKPNPKILTEKDLISIKASGMLFARKFDAHVDTEVLNKLDEWVMGSKL